MTPYFTDPDQDEDLHPTGMPITGASPTSDSEGNQSQGGLKANQGSTGSGFQNLDVYLKKNQPKEFGSQVLGKVQNEVQGAKQSQTQASDQFKSQVQGANQVPTGDQISSAIAKPEQADTGQFQGWLNQSYTGPKSLAEAPDAWNKYWSGTSKAQTAAKQLGTESGRFTLLDSYFGRPGYNTGEKSLDNLLVEGSGLGRETRALQNDATKLKSQGNQQSLALQGEAAKRAGEVEQSRNAARSAIGVDENGQVLSGVNAGAIGKYQQEIQAGNAAANQQREAQLRQVQQDLATGKLTPNELQALGLGQGSGFLPGQSLYGADPSKYLQSSAYSLGQTQTDDQRARLKALSALAGMSDTFSPQAGEMPANPYSFDTGQFLNEVNQGQGAYSRAASSAISNASSPISQLFSNNPNDRLGGNPIDYANPDPSFQKAINWVTNNVQDSSRGPTLQALQNALEQIKSLNKQYGTHSGLDVSGDARVAPRAIDPRISYR